MKKINDESYLLNKQLKTEIIQTLRGVPPEEVTSNDGFTKEEIVSALKNAKKKILKNKNIKNCENRDENVKFIFNVIVNEIFKKNRT